jgi:hypothetical protein
VSVPGRPGDSRESRPPGEFSRRREAAGRIVADLTEGTAHGDVYLRRLRREQLRLALLSLVAFGGLIGALPLILYLLPGLHDARVLGVPVPIWLVVVPPFPLFVAIGWLEQRRADGLDAAFRELVGDQEP